MKKLFKKQMNTHHSKKKVLLVGCLVFALIATLGLFVKQRVDYAKPCGSNSNHELYYRAADVLQKNDPNEAQALASEIKNIKGYENNINCVYPVFAYEVSQANGFEAERLYAQMQNASNIKNRVSKAYEPLDFYGLKDAQAQLDALINEKSNNLNRTFF